MAKFTGKKAYLVSDDEGEKADVVFAQRSVIARREGALALDSEFEYVTCRRAPEYDEYAEEGEVPAKVKYESGWWFTCWHCDQRITEDAQDDDGEPVEQDPVFPGGEMAFCRPACVDAYHAEKAAKKARVEAFVAEVAQKWPGVTDVKVNDYPPDHMTAWFKAPGVTNVVTWVRGEETVSVLKTDLEPWQAFADRCKADRAGSNSSDL